MEKSEFYMLFKEYVEKKYCLENHDPEDEESEKNILEICDKQPELLILPCYDKYYYGPAADLIVRMGYERFKSHIEEVFEWVQDVNWPGADTIIEFLASIPQDELIGHLKNVLRLAYEQKDDFWIYGIYSVIRRAKLSKYFFDDDEFKKILEFGECFEDADEETEETFEILDFESEFQANLHELKLTEFDLHFCSREELGNLILSTAKWNVAQTGEEKQKHLESIVSIREGYKSRYK